jgi:fermentation-respiration switch protein FrsA (DUF1100 family)
VGKGGELSVPDWVDQLLWVLGKGSAKEAVSFAKQFTLEGIADKLTCPLLVVHGENDRQIPVAHAEKTITAAVNSPKRDLKLFRLSEGGAEHCQADNSAMAVDYIADWVCGVLGGEAKGI